MELVGYKSVVVKEGGTFRVTWRDKEHVEQDHWSLNGLFRLAMEVINIAIDGTDRFPFYSRNGGKKWMLCQCNAILEHIGVVNFLFTLEGSDDKDDYWSAMHMLDAYRRFIMSGKPTHPLGINKELLEWMKTSIKDFHFISQTVSKETNEVVERHYKCVDGIYTEYTETLD
jgi:hypothetical protein